MYYLKFNFFEDLLKKYKKKGTRLKTDALVSIILLEKIKQAYQASSKAYDKYA